MIGYRYPTAKLRDLRPGQTGRLYVRRRLIFWATLAIVAAVIVCGAVLWSLRGDGVLDLNCADFARQADAQRVYDATPGDPYDLDRDGDGVACEALPP